MPAPQTLQQLGFTSRSPAGGTVARHGRQCQVMLEKRLAGQMRRLNLIRFKREHRLVLNVAARGSGTRSKVLDGALQKAMGRAGRKWGDDKLRAKVVFNVQSPLTEPLLCVPDYLNWAVQRVFERGEARHDDYLREKIRWVVDLYDPANYEGSANYDDGKRNPLTAKNKLGPPAT